VDEIRDMKVSGSSGVGGANAPKAGARAASGGFSVAGGAGETRRAAPVAGAGGVNSIEALIAMQSVGGPLERRRRAMGRAGRILDMLDEVKLSLLEGAVSPDSLQKLVVAVREQREATDDQGLEGVLNEIETRAAVELAKFAVAA